MSESFVLMHNSSWVVAVLSVLGLCKHPEMLFVQPLLYYRLENISPLCIKRYFLHYYFRGQGFIVFLVSEKWSVLSLLCHFALVTHQVKTSAGELPSVCIFRLSVHSSRCIFTLFLSKGRTIPVGILRVFQYLVSQLTFIKDIAFGRVCWESSGTACCI